MRALIALIAAAAVLGAVPVSAQRREPELIVEREITHVAGDLYRVRAGAQHSMFLVTREGIVVVDPLGLNTALWLNDQFAARFPGVPVKYVVYTHHHAERAAGGGVFKGAVTLGHAKFRGAVRNSSNNSSVNYQHVASPQQTFEDRTTIEIGGTSIDLIHTGSFHSPDMIVVAFRGERILLAADPPPVSKVPFSFRSQRADAVVRWLETVARIEFDTVLFGDGTASTRAAITTLAEYLSRMRGAVLAAYERGQSLRKTIDTVRLDAYKGLPHYAGRTQQISEMYGQVRYVRGDIIFSGIANYLPESATQYCAGFERCMAGGVVPAATVAGLFSIGRRLGVQVEVAISDQFWSTRGRPLYDEETVLRPFLSSALVRFNVTRSRSLSLLAGYTSVTGDVAGINRVQNAFIPKGGQHAIEDNEQRGGPTVGLEFSQRIGAVRLVIPFRVTQSNGPRPEFWPSRLNASAGAGLSIPLFRKLE